MDAADLTYGDNSFDAVVLYNAVGHLDAILDSVLRECGRVVRKQGKIYIISSFRMDRQIIARRFLSQRPEQGGMEFTEKDGFQYVKITEETPCMN